MSTSAVILFAHGAREPEWAQPFESIRDRLRAAGMQVELAFLEFMSPSLDEAAARLAGKGIDTVVIVPLFLAQGAHLKRELPAMVERIGSATRRPRSEWRLRSAIHPRSSRRSRSGSGAQCPEDSATFVVIRQHGAGITRPLFLDAVPDLCCGSVKRRRADRTMQGKEPCAPHFRVCW